MFGDKIKKFLGIQEKNENKEEKSIKGKTDKKKIENLIFFIIIAIITVFCINLIWDGGMFFQEIENTDNKELASTNSINIVDNIDESGIKKTELEESLKNILSKIQGVGEVDILLNYSESSEIIAMYNETSKVSTTEETDDSGGVRKIEETDIQKDIVFQEESGEKIPVTQKVIEPKIEGAIITAEGVTNTNVKTNIIQAVEAVTGLATHKIQVFEMN